MLRAPLPVAFDSQAHARATEIGRSSVTGCGPREGQVVYWRRLESNDPAATLAEEVSREVAPGGGVGAAMPAV
jgi:hypothetical protein